ncbi:MFS transporter [Puniceibacterium sp. IMCC21224]|uniref:MFS transporter n=1 Tax=Puniceibacterium sp. IMCC21224 TaxID=1618204 RepID=UPI00064DA8F0|nr:MFS transporter [Puniceibacterium sp. IMCC21224]KMK65163.1 arabinose efflux permease family protein [Puniceibacterium sp. IMCC21224]
MKQTEDGTTASDTVPGKKMTGGPRFLTALKHRNYRLLWTGTLVSNSGDWLDQVALNWLIISQSGSALDLAAVNLCRAAPLIGLMLVGGAMADRGDKRRLLIMVQSVAMLLAVVLTVLTFCGTTPVWALCLISAGRGAIMAFNLPLRHALIPALVPREDLPNAIALNSVTLNTTKVLGPLSAGLLIAQFGLATCFLVNAVSYIGVLWTLAVMQLPAHPRRDSRGESLAASIRAGVQHVIGHRVLLLLVLVSLLPVFLGQPFIMLLSVFAYSALDWGPVGLGVLTSAAGFGSIAGALLIGGFSTLTRRGDTLLVLLLIFGITLIALALNPVAWMAPVILIFAGAAYMAYNTSLNTILQLKVTDEYRGRVMSTMLLNRGLVPLGTSAAAALSAVASIRVSYAVMGGLILLFTVCLLAFAPALRKLRV